MEFHPTWFIVIGLGFDIVGAFLIIGPIRHGKQLIETLYKTIKEIIDDIDKPEKDKYEITPLSNKEEIDKLTQNIRERQLNEMKAYPKLLIGVGFLVLGFSLQIIGNWFLNPPI